MKRLASFSVSLIFSLGLFFTGCETFCGKCYCENTDAQILPLNDTFNMKSGELYCQPDHRILLSFDSIGEGRCPQGVYCVWEGNARVIFNLEHKKEGASEFTLNTFNGFLTDTSMHGIRIELIDLDPYPVIDVDFSLDSYSATVLISD